MNPKSCVKRGSWLLQATKMAIPILILLALLASGTDPGVRALGSTLSPSLARDQAWAQGHVSPRFTSGSKQQAAEGANSPEDLSDVVITEIMVHPSGLWHKEEWFELLNKGTSDVILDGCRIWDGGAKEFYISSLTIPAGDYVVLGVDGDSEANGGVEVDYDYGVDPVSASFVLPDSTGYIILECDQGGGRAEIDRVHYHCDTFPIVEGASMQLADPEEDNNNSDNWFASQNEWPGSSGGLGTPGAPADGPTAVSLVFFRAEPGAGSVVLTWETASEIDNLGYNLYRSLEPEGPYHQLNEVLIPGQNPGSPVGATYRWLDEDIEPNVTYYYQLEDVDTHGHPTRHGPIPATAGPHPVHTIYLPFVANN